MRDRFPVMLQGTRAYEKLREICPATIPWGLIAPHVERVKKNHEVGLETIAARGGLAPCEIIAAIGDMPIEDAPDPFTAVRKLSAIVEAWASKRGGTP